MRKLVYEVEGLEGAAEVGASARSQLYLLFSDSFHVPDEDFYSDARFGKLGGWIREALERLPYALDGKGSVELLNVGMEYPEFNAEFMGLFEVGLPSPKCPLNESQYLGGQATVFEDLVRFYNFFDLSAAQARELPDHLRIELDFMHFLTFKETERLHSGMDVGSFVRAERDFLERHLGRWVPLLRQKVENTNELGFFHGLTRLLDEFISRECVFLQGRNVEVGS